MAEIVKGTITLYPTKTIIEPYIERNSVIENSYNVYDKITHSYIFQAFIKDEINNRLIIPTGFTPKYLLGMYNNYNIVDKRKQYEDYMNANKTNNKIKLKYDCRNELQKSAISFLNKKDLKTKYRPMQRFLCLKTGEGKTFCAIKYIVDNKERPIIFVDQYSLAEQWKNRIQEYTDTNEDEIFYISGYKSVEKLLKMSTENILKIKFFLCCYKTLNNSLKNKNSSEDISRLFNAIKITIKIFDEAHVEYMSIFKIDMISNLRSIYLSATPQRSDKNENKVYQNIFKQVERFTSNEEKPQENYHNILMYGWNSNPSIMEQSNCETKYGFSMARYCSYLEDNKYDLFEETMYNILFNTVLANRKKKKTAILFGTLTLLEKFYNNLIKYCDTNKYKLTVNSFTGKTDKDKMINILDETDILLTTDKSFSKGIDVKNLQVVVNTVPFTSESKLIQTIGRLRRLPNKEVTFIDINDLGFKSIKRQRNIKKNNVYKNIAKNLFIKE